MRWVPSSRATPPLTSEEAPVELADACDLSVEGPAGWLALLRSLAG